MTEKTKKPDIVPVAYWNSEAYKGDEEGSEKPFLFEITDQRATAGQVFIDVAAENGKPELMAAVTMEINRLPLTKDDLPCVHLHFDESSLAASIFKQGDRFVIRPETGVRLSSGVLENGERAWFLEADQ